jgi:hypothetical protein
MQATNEDPQASLMHHMRGILTSFLVNFSNVVFFWLPGGDPAYGYLLLAIQTLCYGLVAMLFIALPFLRLFIAAGSFAVALGSWVKNGCSLTFLKDAVLKISHSVISPFYRLFEFLTGRGAQFRVAAGEARVPVTMADALTQYGEWTIQSVKVRREPFGTFLNKGLNLITFGAWSSAVKTVPVEQLYHMALLLRLRAPGSTEECVIVLEKNALVKMSDFFESNERQEFHEIRHFPKITLNKFIENAYAKMDKDFFPFDAFHNNCQGFIYGVLSANVKLTKSAKEFILQPLDGLLEKLPKHTSPLTKILTEFGAAIDIAMHSNI